MKQLLMLIVTLSLVSCSDQSPILIGSIGGLSGRYSELGVAGRNAVDLAVSQLNEQGGIHGRKVQLIPVDDKNDIEVCKAQLLSLIKQKCKFVIGPYTSNMAATVTSTIKNKDILVISPTISTDQVTGLDDNFLRVMTSNQDKAKRTAEYIHSRKHTKVAVTFDLNNAAFAETLCNQFENELKTLNPTSTITKIAVDANKNPFSVPADKIITSQSTALFNITAGIDGAALCQQLSKRDHNLLIVGAVWMRTNDLLELGGRAVEGVRFVGQYDAKDKSEQYTNFIKAYTASFGLKPSFSSFYAYEAAQITLNAIRNSTTITPQEIKQQIVSAKHNGLQEPITFDKYGDVIRKATVTKVENGEFVIDEQ